MSGLVRLLRGAVVLGALALGASACGPEYDRTEISGVIESKLGGTIDMTRLEVHEGMIVKAHIVVYDDDNERMPLAFRVVDPSLVEVAGVVTTDDYAFIGRRVGRTQIQLVADGTVVVTLVAEVTAQPPLP